MVHSKTETWGSGGPLRFELQIEDLKDPGQLSDALDALDELRSELEFRRDEKPYVSPQRQWFTHVSETCVDRDCMYCFLHEQPAVDDEPSLRFESAPPDPLIPPRCKSCGADLVEGKCPTLSGWKH